MRAIMLAFAIGAHIPAGAAPVIIVGLPIGGQFKPPSKLCNLDGAVPKQICWIDRPSISKDGTTSGQIGLPNPKGRVSWAEHASFDVLIQPDRILTQLKVKPVPNAYEREEIEGSIALRFGPPNTRSGNGSTWDQASIKIDLLCGTPKTCFAIFAMPPSPAELRRIEAQKQLELARPKTP